MKYIIFLLTLVVCGAAYCSPQTAFVAPTPLPESTLKKTKYRGSFIEGYRQGYALSFFRAHHQFKRMDKKELRAVAAERGQEIYKDRFDSMTSKGFSDAFLTGANDFYRGKIWPSMILYVQSAIQNNI